MTLYFLSGLGCTFINKLVKSVGSPAEVLKAGSRLKEIPGVGSATVSLLTNAEQLYDASQKAEREIFNLEKKQISLLSLSCSLYPSRLKNIQDPPSLLFYKGELSCCETRVVAIVGSRAATEYGKRISFMLGEQLAQKGVTVVSGGAYGIDAAAHKGALLHGDTVAVFGCGLDVMYPQNHQHLFVKIAERGAVISEYSLGAKPERYHFPARNRIVSGLALGVVVVEASVKSGSLITARLALDQGRDVWAVPGRVDSVKSRGCHRLIQQGAHLVQTVEDIVNELELESSLQATWKDTSKEQGNGGTSDNEKKLLSCLDVYPVDIDTLLRVTGFPVSEIYSLLLQLEIKGFIRQLPGQLYELNHK